MDPHAKDSLAQLDNLLAERNQAWLFGAGISVNAGIPLMGPLTEQVLARAKAAGEKDDRKVLDYIKSLLPGSAHIEHILSHIGDHRSIAERSTKKTVSFDKVSFTIDELDAFHKRILTWVSETVRWGYKPANGGAPEKVGRRETPIVTIDDHLKFPPFFGHVVKQRFC